MTDITCKGGLPGLLECQDKGDTSLQHDDTKWADAGDTFLYRSYVDSNTQMAESGDGRTALPACDQLKAADFAKLNDGERMMIGGGSRFLGYESDYPNELYDPFSEMDMQLSMMKRGLWIPVPKWYMHPITGAVDLQENGFNKWYLDREEAVGKPTREDLTREVIHQEESNKAGMRVATCVAAARERDLAAGTNVGAAVKVGQCMTPEWVGYLEECGWKARDSDMTPEKCKHGSMSRPISTKKD